MTLLRRALIPVVAATLAACSPGAVTRSAPASTLSATPGVSATNASTATPSATAAAGPVETTIAGVAARTLTFPPNTMPDDVTLAFGSIWVANHRGETVTRFDPETMTPVADPIPVGGGPGWFVVTDDAIWVTRQMSRGLMRIDPGTNELETLAGQWAPCGRGIVAIGAIWQPACDAGTIMRIDLATDKVRDYIVGDYQSIAEVDGRLLLGGGAGPAWLDPETEKLTKVEGPAGWIIGFDGSEAWVANETDSMHVFDPEKPDAAVELRVYGFGSIAFRADRAWLVAGRQLFEVDRASHAILRTIDFPGDLASVYAAEDALWVTGFDDVLFRLDL